MSSLVSQIETILFVASKPLSISKIAQALQVEEEVVKNILVDLLQKFNQPDSGMRLIKNSEEFQLVSSPENKELAEKFLKSEILGELTKPQLETLTVISYCGPLTRAELEQIRGVNCSIILRNLMMRGLVKEKNDKSDLLPNYEITLDYIRYLGIQSVEELPDYSTLHNHEYIKTTLTISNEITST